MTLSHRQSSARETWRYAFQPVPIKLLRFANDQVLSVDFPPLAGHLHCKLPEQSCRSGFRHWGRVGDRQLLAKAVGRLRVRLATDDLPRGVETETIGAMKVLNDKGNTGVHMTEVDGFIVDFVPDEARHLLSLIEILFTDWYVARHKRLERLKAIESLA